MGNEPVRRSGQVPLTDIRMHDGSRRFASLLWFVRHRSVGILNVNRLLRGTDHDPYPDRLIAFATNECGDYFCFDRDTGRIVSIDPRLFRKSGFLPENCGENGDGRITTGLLQAR